MQFFLPITLLIAAVAAQDTKCAAEPIVETCLSSENAKVEACSATDYDCQCAAYQAVATCYNNCPNDARASPAQNQVTIFCQQASLYGSATTSATTSASTAAASHCYDGTKLRGPENNSFVTVTPAPVTVTAALVLPTPAPDLRNDGGPRRLQPTTPDLGLNQSFIVISSEAIFGFLAGIVATWLLIVAGLAIWRKAKRRARRKLDEFQ
ncbi:unnamed protein product [Colletotrichum noveboracense]|uniref:Gpi anchored serine-threonine rich protein n=1 Tax=Colletotrichum noveboracense TaxID=2664923 RepID=A0A9W4WB81_9PEZI|nr:unnamed protein product [Colletotrichum noveboracense]